MDKATLLALADECERATGPDRELDVRIAMAMHDEPDTVTRPSVERGTFVVCSADRTSMRAALYYTSSLDAAEALLARIAAGWMIDVMQRHDGYSAILFTAGRQERGDCASLCRAIVAASLRARAAMMESRHD